MSDEHEANESVSPFEAIRHTDESAGEYWSARELGPMLGYSRWQRFQPIIAKAETACETSGYTVSDHFTHVGNMVTLGSGAQREIGDVHLSRYACYLIVQNGDPEKPVIAAGQTYFAVQTRRQELADEQRDELDGLTEAQKRLFVRVQVTEHNRLLHDTVAGAGVITARDFATFENHGYRGLYGGETARMIHERKGLAPGERILDWMNSTELAANLFRATQTEEKIRREGIAGKESANATHQAVGREVRETIRRLGGVMPEDQPTPERSIRQLQRQEQKRIESERQPSLFDDPV
ncbi:MAG TPA: DNA damage-inducible protein D [Ktedonobacterales bacterium]|nr:DNA damage-inducible protein D [Ktedonobacterales bacterium]